MQDNKQLFNQLPEDLQEQIKDYLLYFDEVKVWYENKKYHFTVHEIVRNVDSTDFKLIANFNFNDVYGI